MTNVNRLPSLLLILSVLVACGGHVAASAAEVVFAKQVIDPLFRSEGVGVGWVSVLKMAQLRKILGIPHHVIPVAYLCLGYPEEFPSQPLLQTVGWRDRMPISDLLHFDGWVNKDSSPEWEEFQRTLVAEQQ